MRPITRFVQFASLAVAVSFAAGEAAAAPQILGVASAEDPIPLQCRDGVCAADVTTFCMQPHRDVPTPSTAYSPAGGDFQIVLEDAAGKRHRRAAAEVRVTQVRGYTAATLAIAEDAFAAAGLRPVAVAVPRRAVLVPDAVAGDPDPIRADEVASALSVLKPLAEGVFAEHIETLQATTLINRLVNAAPAKGRMASTDRDGLWDRAIGDDPKGAGPAGERARDVLGFCQQRTGAGAFFSVRRCLENRLDGMIMDINNSYWKALQPGS